MESVEENMKRQKIEAALSSDCANLNTWRNLAIDNYGLVNGSNSAFM